MLVEASLFILFYFFGLQKLVCLCLDGDSHLLQDAYVHQFESCLSCFSGVFGCDQASLIWYFRSFGCQIYIQTISVQNYLIWSIVDEDLVKRRNPTLSKFWYVIVSLGMHFLPIQEFDISSPAMRHRIFQVSLVTFRAF